MQLSDHLALFAVLLVSIIILLVVAQAVTKPRTSPKKPAHPLPDYQQQAVDRLLALPQFRRLGDGAIIDYCTGATIQICRCTDPKFPHLTLRYDEASASHIVFGSEPGLTHYVRLQELIARHLADERPTGGPPTPGVFDAGPVAGS